jgi:hypothetical protein
VQAVIVEGVVAAPLNATGGRIEAENAAALFLSVIPGEKFLAASQNR